MSSFAALQRSLASLLTRPDPLDSNEEAHALAAAHILPTEELSGVERLEIYRQQYWLRHSGTLVDDYPGLAGVVGHQHWPRFVEEYLAWAQVDSWTLKDLGVRLERYVAECGTWLPRRALCFDMARLESAYMQVFDAPDAELDEARIRQISPSQWASARFELSPALRLVRFDYPVDALRRQLRAARAAERVPTPAPRVVHAAVYRGADRILYHREVDAEQWQVLRNLAEGKTLVTAFDAVVAGSAVSAEALVARAQGWFSDWPRLAWVTDVRVP